MQVSYTNSQTGPGFSGGGRPESQESQEACPRTLKAEGKCHMKIHKPARALLGVEGEGPVKIRKLAQALWRLIPQPSACLCF
jgi:hypothetical protein